MHFQFPASTTNSPSRISIRNTACLSDCMVPGVLQLRKIVLIMATLYILLKYYFLYYKRDVRNKLLIHVLPAPVILMLLQTTQKIKSSKQSNKSVGAFVFKQFAIIMEQARTVYLHSTCPIKPNKCCSGLDVAI